MSTKNRHEKPFEKLLRHDGSRFDDKVVENWYIARAYVLDKLKDVAISPSSSETLKVVVEIDSCQGMMLSVVRQIALVAHYPNYEEYDGFGRLSRKNCTEIVLVTKLPNIYQELKKEEYLNNLLEYGLCHKGQELKDGFVPIDINFEVVAPDQDNFKDGFIRMTYSDVEKYRYAAGEGIDTRMAVLASKVYDQSVEIGDLPYEDIHNAGRYNRALDIFKYRILSDVVKPLVTSEWDGDQVEVKNGLSNIFCADRFVQLEAGMKDEYEKAKEEFCKKCEKDKCKPCLKKGRERCGKKEKVKATSCWEKYDLQLAVSEHTRWVAEKLILGFRPMCAKERDYYENHFGNQRKLYGKLLKGDVQKLRKTFPEIYEKNECFAPTHVNLCSFKELRRVDPDNRKYDSFLMLAILLILDKTKKDEKKDL